MQSRRFKQVDVFTAQAYLGNALAVVLDGEDLSDADMQRFACWTNLSETTFLLPPTDAAADYRVRIFTPGGELPFAGHPTLGSCHAWLQAGGQAQSAERVVQQCAKGLIHITREAGSGASGTSGTSDASGRLAFAAPALQRSTPTPALLADVTAALGITPSQVLAAQSLDNGPLWCSLLLDSPATVLQLTPDHAALARLGVKVGVAGIYPDAEESESPLIRRANREAAAFGARSGGSAAPRLEVRAFAAATGINEDPVTGSLNASLAQWLIGEGLLPDQYIASQGINLGRAGQVHVRRDATGQVWIGGHTVTCIEGTVQL
jgi:PhzF family phenazine biosynthesis protein